ncbi:cytochrome P450 [Agarilytica rhodophyticola]|uniref:cytochrome P450 n=1 Tax=Agarilytica rhodophyticola TaxID=1737490 RepID=UPI000B341AAC|nr:cytochrome P450 [Agarilytica rhodophyticola]
MNKSEHIDPFKKVRSEIGHEEIDDHGDPVTMILRHKDVRKVAHNWRCFSSDAPGRIPVPSEVNIRTTRQIPFEVDPPDHTHYRRIVEPIFKRPLHKEFKEQLKNQIEALIKFATQKKSIEVISEFSLPLQSKALTLLLNMPPEEAELWIGWGTHVFRGEGDTLDRNKASILYDYIDKQMDIAIVEPSDNFFSTLLNSEYKGRKLTREEVKGIAMLTFAGGRDTVINLVSNTLAYIAEHPDILREIKKDSGLIPVATEEFIRYFSPLTHMGRVVKEDSEICHHMARNNTRVSLCWASANRDENVFEDADTVKVNRKINPHMAFGFGTHNCLGATHTRQIMQTLLSLLTQHISSIVFLSGKENIEQWGRFSRKVGYNTLNLEFIG